MLPDFDKRLVALIAALTISTENIDLIVDLGTPTYEPYSVFAGALIPALAKIPTLNQFRSFVLVGTAFPDSMKEMSSDNLVERHDWKFFVALRKVLPNTIRRPIFGDYTIVHPGFVANMDMRMIKPAGKLVYTTAPNWIIKKGGAFRDNPKQMHQRCDEVVKSPYFRGAAFSFGDGYIQDCATKIAGPSSMTMWKTIGINHHITQVLADVSTLGARP